MELSANGTVDAKQLDERLAAQPVDCRHCMEMTAAVAQNVVGFVAACYGRQLEADSGCDTEPVEVWRRVDMVPAIGLESYYT